MDNTYISLDYLFSQLINIPTEFKLKTFLELSGVTFFDDEKNFIKLPSVKICGFGGAGIEFHNGEACIGGSNLTANGFFKEAKKMRAYGGFMSYLNSTNKTTNQMIEILEKNGHFSTEHMIFINILVSGISTSVENEFNSQRDIIHLSRITEARTKIQSNPPYVILNEQLIPIYSFIKEHIKNEIYISGLKPNNLDELEALNLIHPSGKGTAVILSGSIRNFKKLIAMKEDSGKEFEFRRILNIMEQLFKTNY